MSDIALVRRHSLSIAKAKAQVRKAAEALAAEHALSSKWHGDTLYFERTGLHGEIHVSHSEIRLDVTLGFLLKPFRAAFLTHIERDLAKYLPEPAPADSTKRRGKRTTHTAR